MTKYDWTSREYINTFKFQKGDNYKAAQTRFYYSKFSRIAESIYTWDLQNSGNINSEKIENYLWECGNCCIYNDTNLGQIVAKTNITEWGANGQPVKWRPYLENGIEPAVKGDLTSDNSVFITDTLDINIRRSDCLFLIPDIVDTKLTIRQQVWNQKTPLMGIAGDPAQKLKLKNAMVNIGDNANIIFFDQDIADQVKVLDFNAPFNSDKLLQIVKTYENDILEYLGCDANEAFAHKERNNTDEVDANTPMLSCNLYSGLASRQKGLKEMTKIFGVTGTVDVTESVRPDESDRTGGEENDDTATPDV